MEFKIPDCLDGLGLEAHAQLETEPVATFDALRDDTNLNSDAWDRGPERLMRSRRPRTLVNVSSIRHSATAAAGQILRDTG